MMKTTYLIAGIAGMAAALYFLKVRTGGNSSKLPTSQHKLTVNGENHIRGIMKKSKQAV
jgi:hypothetical protein